MDLGSLSPLSHDKFVGRNTKIHQNVKDIFMK